MKRIFRAIAVVLLGVCLETSLVAQAIAPRTFRAVAGESHSGALRDGVPPMTAIISARTLPPLEFPIRVLTTSVPETLGLKLVIPPATPPGDYTVEVEGRGPAGRGIATRLQVRVDPVREAGGFRPSQLGLPSSCSMDFSLSATIPPARSRPPSIPSASSLPCCKRTA